MILEGTFGDRLRTRKTGSILLFERRVTRGQTCVHVIASSKVLLLTTATQEGDRRDLVARPRSAENLSLQLATSQLHWHAHHA